MHRNEEAFAHLDRATKIAEEAGDLAAQATPLFTKAFALMDVVGDYEAAEATYQRSYKLAKETHHRVKIVWHYWHFAQLHRRQGRFEEARESMEYYFQQSADIVNQENRAKDLGLLVRLCVLCDALYAAEKYFEPAWDMVKEVDPEHVDYALRWAKGTLLAFKGDTEGALDSFQRASESIDDPHHRGELMLEYGQFLKETGDNAEARRVLQEARDDLEHGSRALVSSAQEELSALDASA